jgi:MarR family transcriptional regulator for hemolysin
MPRPAHQPLGLHLTRVSRTVSRAFDDALAEAGGSLPVWLVLISLKSGQLASQRELAEAVGVQGATLTYHLNAMEAAGLVTRRRDPANRRLHLVEMTPDGDALFFRLRDVAMAFDQRLRAGLSESDASQLETLLTRLRDNVSTSPDERGAVIACYYVLAYLGFGVPYLADGLGALVGKTGAFVALTAIFAVLALWTAGYAASLRRAVRGPEGDTIVRWSPGDRNSVSR